MQNFAQDSKIPPKKIFFRELISSLHSIKHRLDRENSKENEEKGEICEARSTPIWVGAHTHAHTHTRKGEVKEFRPVNPRLAIRKLTPNEARDIIKDGCSLIKTVDKDLIPGIERRVKRIYEKGNTTRDTLYRYLTKECDLEDYQAERIIRDQMQKYEARAALERMRKAGVKLVRWCHGNSKEPRPHHFKPYPYGLNGGVFDIDHAPVIDPATGERGWPGQLIGCHCHLEAVE